ncbi:MAG: hypothetical protein B0D91_05540 [Oceanospirillales bacterium LUC14_002_19_P2]|nr:MAG: hypothetical protein B0D91_05540 [Oceanospirillales bacterium LUC14_002_19_P2]
MCGRFTLLREQVDCRQFGLDLKFHQLPHYNIAPRDQVTLIRDNPQRECVTANWGLVPGWLKDLSRAQINAREETIAEKPMFRNAFRQRRCLIPADGYFEWQSLPDRKQPWYIRKRDKSLMAFAGIWERYHASEDVFYDSCAIITTAANPLTAKVHDRIPVILQPEHYTTWLSTDSDLADCQSLLQPLASELLQLWPVSTYVNNPSHKGPQCIEAIAG